MLIGTGDKTVKTALVLTTLLMSVATGGTSALAQAQSTGLAPAGDAPIVIPLDIVGETTLNSATNPANPYPDQSSTAFRLGINVGVNGAVPKEYIFDTGSTAFNIAVGANYTSSGVAWLPVQPGVAITPADAALYGDGSYGNLATTTTASSIEFYGASGNKVAGFQTPGLPVTLNVGQIATQSSLGTNTAGAVVGIYNGLGFVPTAGLGGLTPQQYVAAYPGSQLMYLNASWQNAVNQGLGATDIPYSNRFYGYFGAGDFGSDSVLGNLTKTGYVVAANSEVGANQTCNGCGHVILNLTAAVRAQFVSVMPWSSGSFQTSPLSGAPVSASGFDTAFTYVLSNGKQQLIGDLPTLLDSGTNSYTFFSDAFQSAAAAAGFIDPKSTANEAGTGGANGNIPQGLTLTATGDVPGSQTTSITTGNEFYGDVTYTGSIYPTNIFSEMTNGLPFFFANSVMYDLQKQSIGYTPFFVSVDPIDTTGGYRVTSAMRPQGIAGVISGTGPFEVTSGGSAQLSGANTYTGATLIDKGGWLGLAAANAVASSSGLTANGTFDISRANPLNYASTTAQLAAAENALAADENALNEITVFLQDPASQTSPYYNEAESLLPTYLNLVESNTNTIAQATADQAAALMSATVPVQSLSGSGEVDLGGSILELTKASGAFSGQIIDGGLGGGTDGSLIIAGGAETLSGANSFTGPTGINTGAALNLTGSLNGSVSNHGLLTGNGTIGGNLNVYGTIAPGAGNGSYQTLTVKSSYEQLTGSVYLAQLSPTPGVSSRIAVGEKAILDPGAGLALAVAPSTPQVGYAIGKKYTVLTAGGGLTGTFDKLSVVGADLPFLSFGLSYSPTAALVDVGRGISFSSVAATHNGKAVAGAVDNLGDSNGLLNAASQLTAAQASVLFNQGSGEIHASLQGVYEDADGLVRQAAIDRATAGSAPKQTGVSLWSDVSSLGGDRRTDGNAARVEQTSNAFLIGGELSVADIGKIGVVGGEGDSDVTGGLGDRARSNNYHYGIYGSANAEALSLSGGILFSRHNARVTRSIRLPGLDQDLRSTYHVDDRQIFTDAGLNLPVNSAVIQPFLQYANIGMGHSDISENGGSLALSGEVATSTLNLATAGIRIKSVWSASGHPSRFSAMVSFGYRRAWGDRVPSATLQFVGSSAFSVNGLGTDRSVFTPELNVAYNPTSQISLGLGYSGEFANRIDNHVGNARLVVSF